MVAPRAWRVDEALDTELARRAAAGDQRAAEELYRRHVHGARRVASRVLRDSGEADDVVGQVFLALLEAVRNPEHRGIENVRAYLLTSVRRAALARRKERARVLPSSNNELNQVAAPASGPVERVIDLTDGSFVREAFHRLPERWRQVLALTELRGLGPAEVAATLSLTPNAAAQLAFRAREGLRAEYLQAHLGRATHGACRTTVSRLGAHLLGRLGPRDGARVERHLAECARCRERRHELSDLGETLRRALIPLEALLARMVSPLGRAREVMTSTAPTLQGRPRIAAVAAALALLLGGPMGSAHDREPDALAAAPPATTPIGPDAAPPRVDETPGVGAHSLATAPPEEHVEASTEVTPTPGGVPPRGNPPPQANAETADAQARADPPGRDQPEGPQPTHAPRGAPAHPARAQERGLKA